MFWLADEDAKYRLRKQMDEQHREQEERAAAGHSSNPAPFANYDPQDEFLT